MVVGVEFYESLCICVSLQVMPLPFIFISFEACYTVIHTSQGATSHSAVEKGPQYLGSTDQPEKCQDFLRDRNGSACALARTRY